MRNCLCLLLLLCLLFIFIHVSHCYIVTHCYCYILFTCHIVILFTVTLFILLLFTCHIDAIYCDVVFSDTLLMSFSRSLTWASSKRINTPMGIRPRRIHIYMCTYINIYVVAMFDSESHAGGNSQEHGHQPMNRCGCFVTFMCGHRSRMHSSLFSPPSHRLADCQIASCSQALEVLSQSVTERARMV